MRAGNIIGFSNRFCKKTKTAEAMADHVQCNLRGIFLHPCDPIRFLTSLGHQFFDSLTLVAPSQARPCSAEAPLGPLSLPRLRSFPPQSPTHPLPAHPLSHAPPPLIKAASVSHPPDPPIGDFVALGFLYGGCRGKRNHIFLCGLECFICDNSNAVSVMLRA